MEPYYDSGMDQGMYYEDYSYNQNQYQDQYQDQYYNSGMDQGMYYEEGAAPEVTPEGTSWVKDLTTTLESISKVAVPIASQFLNTKSNYNTGVGSQGMPSMVQTVQPLQPPQTTPTMVTTLKPNTATGPGIQSKSDSMGFVKPVLVVGGAVLLYALVTKNMK